MMEFNWKIDGLFGICDYLYFWCFFDFFLVRGGFYYLRRKRSGDMLRRYLMELILHDEYLLYKNIRNYWMILCTKNVFMSRWLINLISNSALQNNICLNLLNWIKAIYQRVWVGIPVMKLCNSKVMEDFIIE
jgi:hypothetical protein